MRIKDSTLNNIRVIILSMIIFLTSVRLRAITHPVNIAGILILIALLRSLFLGKLIIRWLLYLLALVFLGGVIVVLLFIVSVCANEKFFYKGNNTKFLRAAVWLLGALAINKVSLMAEGISGVRLPLVLYQSEGIFTFILFMRVLVLCMFRVVKIRKLESGPLVKRLYFNSLNKTLCWSHKINYCFKVEN